MLEAPVASQGHPEMPDANFVPLDRKELWHRLVQDHGDTERRVYVIIDWFAEHLAKNLEPHGDALKGQIERNLEQPHVT